MALTVDEIRLCVKDNPFLNILLEGDLQSSDELIAFAMKMAVSEFNGIPPMSQFSAADFPSDHILLDGTLYRLCMSESERQLRNNIDFSGQGLQAGLDNKYRDYMEMAKYYKDAFYQAAQSFKINANTEQAWDGMHSPYAAIFESNFRSS